MILNEVFERFAEESPVTVMARAALENALTPTAVDALFEDDRRAAVHPRPAVLRRRRPDGHGRLQDPALDQRRLQEEAPRPSASRSRPSTTRSTASSRRSAPRLVRHTATALAPVIAAMGGRLEPWLPGYRIKILDGNHLPGTEHRLKPLRTERAGALPGQALVVLDPAAMLVIDVIPCEDGHAQERSLTEAVLETGPARRPVDRRPQLLHDRLPLRDRRAGRFLRDPPARLDADLGGSSASGGPRAGARPGRSSSRRCGSTDGRRRGRSCCGGSRWSWTSRPATATREIHILTNLPRGGGRRDRGRRRVPQALDAGDRLPGDGGDAQRRDRHAGLPEAALFAFCVALVSYNVMSVVKAALRSVHGAEAIDAGVSG